MVHAKQFEELSESVSSIVPHSRVCFTSSKLIRLPKTFGHPSAENSLVLVFYAERDHQRYLLISLKSSKTLQVSLNSANMSFHDQGGLILQFKTKNISAFISLLTSCIWK